MRQAKPSTSHLSSAPAAELPRSPAPHCGGRQLRACFLAATIWLERRSAMLNSLNVFPVPDGDTGTNMALTMRTAVRALSDEATASEPASSIASTVEQGALMGARGNSGVILSQLLRGFARALKDRDDFDGRDLAEALREAADMAYKAVIKPVEGTMLTVARETAEAAVAAARERNEAVYVLEQALVAARESVRRTPEKLDLLRQAGVVDAGGQGIVVLLEGVHQHVTGAVIEIDEPATPAPSFDPAAVHEQHPDEYGYCINFMVTGENMPYEEIRAQLAGMGQSAVIVGHESLIKAHLHSERPGEALEYAVRFGALSQIKIENMDLQHADLEKQSLDDGRAATINQAATTHGIGVLAVASGDGFERILLSLGASGVVRGGQRMNPSAEEIVRAIEALPQREVILLPNHGTIVMAARQAASLTSKRVEILATKTMPQGITALLNFSPDRSLDENCEMMGEAATQAKTGEVTRAVRSVEIHGVRVEAGQIIAVLDDKVVAAVEQADIALRKLLEAMAAGECEIISVYCGQGVDRAAQERVSQNLAEIYTDQAIEVHYGGQPYYDFIVAVE